MNRSQEIVDLVEASYVRGSGSDGTRQWTSKTKLSSGGSKAGKIAGKVLKSKAARYAGVAAGGAVAGIGGLHHVGKWAANAIKNPDSVTGQIAKHGVRIVKSAAGLG